ncbi:MAG: TRAP transporter substrate-binding protein DctP [Reyranella sp.]|nr:TRAP transporter substrate-binding protein DctP [Reyranella sp.]
MAWTKVKSTALVALAALLFTPGAEAQDKIVWDIAIYGPPREITAPIEYFAKYVDEKTGGKFTLKLHYSESIAPAKSVLDSLKIEAIQGGLVAFGYTPGKVPLHLALDLPYLPIPDLDAFEKVQEAFYAWEPAKKELARFNGVALFVALLPQYEFMGSGKAPKTLDDWKGMRVRALGPGGDAMRTLGAVPTSVPAPEVYTALERGTFQASSFPFSYSFASYKLYEVSKWYTMGMHFGIVNNAWVFSKTAYDKLPADYKMLFDTARPEFYKIAKEVYRKADERNIPMFDKTLERITFTPETLAPFIAKAGKPVWDKWVADGKTKGLPAQEALDMVLKSAKAATAK